MGEAVLVGLAIPFPTSQRALLGGHARVSWR
jgi:hypothetical protein